MARFPFGNDGEHAILDVADAGDLPRPFHRTNENWLVHRFRHCLGNAPVH